MNIRHMFPMLLLLLTATPTLAQEANMFRYDPERYEFTTQSGDAFTITEEGEMVNSVRLYGYDAPLMEEARLVLNGLLLTGGMVVCERMQWGDAADEPMIMKCRIDGHDIGESMMRAGYAEAIWEVAGRENYGKRLHRLMQQAQDNERGVWRKGE